MSSAVDLSSTYWEVKQSPETVLRLNGCNLHYSHYLRVLDARLTADLTAPRLLLPLGVAVIPDGERRA